MYPSKSVLPEAPSDMLLITCTTYMHMLPYTVPMRHIFEINSERCITVYSAQPQPDSVIQPASQRPHQLSEVTTASAGIRKAALASAADELRPQQ